MQRMARTREMSVDEPSRQCEFCGYGIHDTPVTPDPDSPHTFCSEGCCAAFEAGDTPFVGRHSYKRRFTGVSALDTLLPWGMPSNSFVLLSGAPGIRHRELQTELLWRTLTRGEPAGLSFRPDRETTRRPIDRPRAAFAA